jgi:lipopolysaccharide transport system permease protein
MKDAVENPATRTPVAVLRPPDWTDVWSRANVSRLVAFGHLFVELSRHRIAVRYKQSLLGPAWALLQPLAMMAIATLVFSKLAQMPSDGIPYALLAYSGLLPWTFFSSAVSSGTTSLTSHAALVTKVAFPREILPATYIVAALVDFVVASVMLVLLCAWYHVAVGWSIVAVVPVVAVLAAFAFAVTLVLSATQVRVRDIGVALPVMLQVLVFASPVLYPLSAVPARFRSVYILNPLAGLVDAFRAATLGRQFDASALAIAVAATAIVLPLAFAVFKRTERTMADEM